MIFEYDIHQTCEYINWIYFFHAWNFQPKYAAIANIHECNSCITNWINTFDKNEKEKAFQALQLFKDAKLMLNSFEKKYKTKAICEIKECNSEGDDILIDNFRIPFLRQQTINNNGYCLCLSDFIRPIESCIKDKIALFATTVDKKIQEDYITDEYQKMLAQTLSDRLAEATAEKLHEHVRKELWGYCKDEKLTIKQMLNEEYIGTRPAIGYPSIPDQSINFILNDIIKLNQIDIKLTENGMMLPHASVSGFMLSHEKSQHFSIGKISKEQLTDYSRRRGFTVEEATKYLSANL